MKEMFNVPVMLVNEKKEQFLADRSVLFKNFIFSLLNRSKLKAKYMEQLTSEENIGVYANAFTHISIDPDRNYEYLEILGDVTCNKCVVWYIKDRFPQLQNPNGVKVIARLRINLVSKKNFSTIAERLGFFDFISSDKEIREQKGRSLLEDVFEAFFGATELLLDKITGLGSGYGICYRIMKSILDEIPLSLKYEDLYDPITRLKETFDYYRQQVSGRKCDYIWGNMLWENTKSEKGYIVHLFQFDKSTNRKQLLISTEGSALDETKQLAASQYLEILYRYDVKRPIPEYYKTLTTDPNTKRGVF